MASNQRLLAELRNVSDHYGLDFHAPPPHLCTDNGVMIAWAALERLKAMEAGQVVRGAWLNGMGVHWGAEATMLEPLPRLPLGADMCDQVTAMNIHVKLDYKRHKPSHYFRAVNAHSNSWT